MPKTSEKRAPGSRPAVDAGIPVKVVDALIEVFGIDEDEITMDSTLVDDLGADSLDVVELAMTLEESYGRSIGDQQVETWEYVRDVVRTVEPAAVR